MNLALEKIKSENPYISILGMQLLLTYMYTGTGDNNTRILMTSK
jgi:hypothetical protein